MVDMTRNVARKNVTNFNEAMSALVNIPEKSNVIDDTYLNSFMESVVNDRAEVEKEVELKD